MTLPRRFDRLFVLWHEAPPTKARHVIGELRRDPDRSFVFAYDGRARAAEEAGFRLLLEFPNRSQEYRAQYLFSTFAQRIPSPKRPDYAALLDRWGVVDRDDPMEILARSGGLLATDNLEVSEWRGVDDDLHDPLQFRIAGEAYVAKPANDVAEGAALVLQTEPSNSRDPWAVRVLDGGGVQLGYVPRQYSELVSRKLQSGIALSATAVRRVELAPGGQPWSVSVRAVGVR